MPIKLAMVTVFPEKPGVVNGGVEGVAHCLTWGLRQVEPDMEIHIIAPCFTRMPGIEQRDGMTIHWLKQPRLPAFLTYWNIFRRTLHRKLEEIGPDITHFQNVAGWTLAYERPHVLTIHGINEKDVLYAGRGFRKTRSRIIGFIERLGRQRATDVILISPYVLEEIGNQIRGTRWPIENPVTADFFEVRNQGEEPRILFVGRISERKNVLGLLRAFRQAREKIPGASLRLGGSPDEAYRAECQNYIHEHGLENAVSFLGNLDRDALRYELAGARCLALVAHQETAPMVVEEAMAAGVPVVASRLCGLPYMVEEGQSGFLVNPSDEDEIAARLVDVLGDKEKGRQMGERGREIARERFHAVAVAKKTLEAYRHAMDGVAN